MIVLLLQTGRDSLLSLFSAIQAHVKLKGIDGQYDKCHTQGLFRSSFMLTSVREAINTASSSSNPESDSESEDEWDSRPSEVLHIQGLPSPPEVAFLPAATRNLFKVSDLHWSSLILTHETCQDDCLSAKELFVSLVPSSFQGANLQRNRSFSRLLPR